MLAALALVGLGGCSTAAPAPPSPQPTPTGPTRPATPLPVEGDDGADLQTLLHGLALRHRVCHVVAAVVQGGVVQQTASAGGCHGKGAPPPVAGVFQAASLSKPVFAYAVLQLVQQGRLALDAPVARYLPAGHPATVPGTALGRVTVRMLLNHSSGLPNDPAAGWALSFPPGQGWQYAGQGYALLQRAVEHVTGQGLQAAVQRLVFQPLGMAHSSFVWQDRLQPLVVVGHAAGGQAYPVRRFGAGHAAATLLTTAADYGRFLAALLGDPATLKAITDGAVTADAALQLRWGLGWGLEPRGDDTWLWQWGNNPGFKAFALAAPGRGTALVVLTNSDAGLRLAPVLVRSVLAAEPRLFGFRMLR